jgi:8-oxo-dGTP pyrophosphatase MutT (NUDIX family)
LGEKSEKVDRKLNLETQEENPWKTLTHKVVYENPWIEISHREVVNPNGGNGIYGVVSFKNLAIGVVPVDDNLNTFLVGQYRYTLNHYSWEIPEGGGPMGEEPLETAKRELLEETGLLAEDWVWLSSIHTSNSVTDEFGHIFLARNLKQTEANPEETEDLRVVKIPLIQAVEMVEKGEITDSLSIAGLLMAARKLGV